MTEKLIGMPEAARRLGVSSTSARRALLNAGVPLVHINARALAVSERDLAALVASRAGYAGRGRPQQPKETATKEAAKVPNRRAAKTTEVTP